MILLFGPRLDRPSAIGEEGRPRATSLSIAAFTVFALFVATTYAVGMVQLLPIIGFAVGVAVAGMTMLDRNRIGPLLLGHLSFLPFASALVGLVYMSFTVTPFGALGVGFTLSALGVAGSWANVLDDDHVRSVTKQSVIAYVSMVCSVVALFSVISFGSLVLEMVRAFVSGGDPSASVVGFALLVFVFGLSLRTALSVVPIAQLAPASKRATYAERVTRWRETATDAAAWSIVAVVVLTVCLLAGILETMYAAVPGLATLFVALSSPFVVLPTVAIAAVCLLAAAGAWLVRRLARNVDPSAARDHAAAIAGPLLLITIVPLVAAGLSVSGGYGYLMAVFFAVVGPPAVFLALGVWLAAVALGVLPDRASGPALAGAGLVVTTVGAGVANAPSPMVFACAAGALLVWDAGSFGLGVTAELGHLPETRRLELFHGVLSVAIGVAAVVVLTGIDRLRVLLGSAVGAMPAAILAVVGVLALLVQFRE